MSQLLRGCSHVIDESLDEFLVRHDPDYHPQPRPDEEGVEEDDDEGDFSSHLSPSSSFPYGGSYRAIEEDKERRGGGGEHRHHGEDLFFSKKTSPHSRRADEEDPQKRSSFQDTSSSAFPECSLLHDGKRGSGGQNGGSFLKKGSTGYSTASGGVNGKKRGDGHYHTSHSMKSLEEGTKIVNTQKLQRALSVAVTGLGEQVKQGGEMLWRTAVTAAGQVIVQHGLHHRSVGGGVGFPSSPSSLLSSASSSSFASAVSSASCFNLPHIAAAAISSNGPLAGGLSLIGLDPHAGLGGGGTSLHAWLNAPPSWEPEVWGDGNFHLSLKSSDALFFSSSQPPMSSTKDITGQLVAEPKPKDPSSEEGHSVAFSAAGGAYWVYRWSRLFPNGVAIDVPDVKGNAYYVSADDVGCKVRVTCTPRRAGGACLSSFTGEMHAALGPFQVDVRSRSCVLNSFAKGGSRFPCCLATPPERDDDCSSLDGSSVADTRDTSRHLLASGATSRERSPCGGEEEEGKEFFVYVNDEEVVLTQRSAATHPGLPSGGGGDQQDRDFFGSSSGAAGLGGKAMPPSNERKPAEGCWSSSNGRSGANLFGHRWSARFGSDYPKIVLSHSSPKHFTIHLSEDTSFHLSAYTRHQRDLIAMTLRCFHARSLITASSLLDLVHSVAIGIPGGKAALSSDELVSELEDKRVDLYVMIQSLHHELQSVLLLRDRTVRDCERVRREKEALEEEMTFTIQAFQQQIADLSAAEQLQSSESESDKDNNSSSSSKSSPLFWGLPDLIGKQASSSSPSSSSPSPSPPSSKILQLTEELQSARAQNRSYQEEIESLKTEQQEMILRYQNESENFQELLRKRLEGLMEQNRKLQEANEQLGARLLQQTSGGGGGGSAAGSGGMVDSGSAAGRGLRHQNDPSDASSSSGSHPMLHSRGSLSPERKGGAAGGQGDSIDQLQAEIRRLRKAVDEAHLEKHRLAHQMEEKKKSFEEERREKAVTLASVQDALIHMKARYDCLLDEMKVLRASRENAEEGATKRVKVFEDLLLTRENECTQHTRQLQETQQALADAQAERNRLKKVIESITKDLDKSRATVETATSRHQVLLQEKEQTEKKLQEILRRMEIEQQRNTKETQLQQEENLHRLQEAQRRADEVSRQLDETRRALQQEQSHSQMNQQRLEVSSQQQIASLQQKLREKDNLINELKKEIDRLRALVAQYELSLKNSREKEKNTAGAGGGEKEGETETQLRARVSELTSVVSRQEEEMRKLKDESVTLKTRLIKLSKGAGSGGGN